MKRELKNEVQVNLHHHSQDIAMIKRRNYIIWQTTGSVKGEMKEDMEKSLGDTASEIQSEEIFIKRNFVNPYFPWPIRTLDVRLARRWFTKTRSSCH